MRTLKLYKTREVENQRTKEVENQTSRKVEKMRKLTRAEIRTRAREEYHQGNICTARIYHSCALCNKKIRKGHAVARDCVSVANYRVCLPCASGKSPQND